MRRSSAFSWLATLGVLGVACTAPSEPTATTSTDEADYTAADVKILGDVTEGKPSSWREFDRTSRCNGYRFRVRGNDRVLLTIESTGPSYGAYLFDASWNQLAHGTGSNRRTIDALVPSGGTYVVAYCDANFHGVGHEISYRVTASSTPTCIASCAEVNKNCGAISDRCGYKIDCGECASAAETCGGAGIANVCGVPKPTTCTGPATWSNAAKLAEHVNLGNATAAGRGVAVAVDGIGRLHVAYAARTQFNGDKAYYVSVEPRGGATKPVELGPGHEVAVAATSTGPVYVAAGWASGGPARLTSVYRRDSAATPFSKEPDVSVFFGSPSLGAEESGTLYLAGLASTSTGASELRFVRKGAADAAWTAVPFAAPVIGQIEDHSLVIDGSGFAHIFSVQNGASLIHGVLTPGGTAWKSTAVSASNIDTLRATKASSNGAAVATYSPETPYPIGAFAIAPDGKHHVTSAVPTYPFRHTDGETETDLAEEGVKHSAIAIDAQGVVSVVYVDRYAQLQLRRRAPSCP